MSPISDFYDMDCILKSVSDDLDGQWQIYHHIQMGVILWLKKNIG